MIENILEALAKNNINKYIVSSMEEETLELYLIKGNLYELPYQCLIVNFDSFYNESRQKNLKQVGDKFISVNFIQKLTTLYGTLQSDIKISKAELILIFYMIQNIAIQLCLENLVELNCVNKDNALAILDKWEIFNNKNN